jgi:hypothetical protein
MRNKNSWKVPEQSTICVPTTDVKIVLKGNLRICEYVNLGLD